jgi:hypothetical protein
MDAMGNKELPQKRKLKGKDSEVEEAVNLLFSLVTGRGVRVIGSRLKSKSRLAKRLGHNDFRATDGWLSWWKCRLGTKFKKAFGEYGAVLNTRNPQSCQTYFRNFAQMIIAVPMKQIYFIMLQRTVP